MDNATKWKNCSGLVLFYVPWHIKMCTGLLPTDKINKVTSYCENTSIYNNISSWYERFKLQQMFYNGFKIGEVLNCVCLKLFYLYLEFVE